MKTKYKKNLDKTENKNEINKEEILDANLNSLNQEFDNSEKKMKFLNKIIAFLFIIILLLNILAFFYIFKKKKNSNKILQGI